MWQLRMHCNLRPPDVSLLVLCCFWPCTLHANELLFRSFRSILTSPLDSATMISWKENNNLTIRRFHTVTLTFDTWPWVFVVAYIWCHVVHLCTKFERNRTIGCWVIEKFSKISPALLQTVTSDSDALTLKLCSISVSCVETMCKISAKSYNLRLT